MVKKLKDCCFSCIERNIASYYRLGSYLSLRDKEVLLERMCCHNLLLPTNTSSIIYHLFSHTLQRVNLSYSGQVNDSILSLLGQSGCLLTSITIHCCPNVTDKGISALGRILRKVEKLKLKKLSRKFTGKGLETVKSRTVSVVNLKGNPLIEDMSIITLVNNCPNITKLNLGELHKLSDRAFIHLAKILNNKLVKLDICEMNLMTSKSTLALAEHCRNLNVVKLESCVKLDGSGLIQMAECCNISFLCISFCYKVTTHACEAIVSLLRASRVLHQFEAIGLNVTPLAMEMLASTSSLTSLDLSGVPNMSDDMVEMITKAAGGILVEFDISSCANLTDQSCASISRHCTALEVLGMCNLRNITGSDLSSFFVDGNRVKHFRSISLSGCKKMGHEVVELIVNRCPNLETITIAGIKDITDGVPDALAMHCKQLKRASFRNCNLTDEGVCRVAVHCSELVIIALSGIHELTDRSIVALAENCPCLRELYISGCDKITKQAVTYLQDCAVGRVMVKHSTPNAPFGLLMAKDLDVGKYLRVDLLDYDNYQ